MDSHHRSPIEGTAQAGVRPRIRIVPPGWSSTGTFARSWSLTSRREPETSSERKFRQPSDNQPVDYDIRFQPSLASRCKSCPVSGFLPLPSPSNNFMRPSKIRIPLPEKEALDLLLKVKPDICHAKGRTRDGQRRSQRT